MEHIKKLMITVNTLSQRSNEMTRENATQNLWKAHCNFYNPRKAMNIVIEQIYNDHEAQLKAKDEEIAKYQMAIDKQSKRAEALKQLSLDKDNEIATAKMRHKLEHDRYLITEAIIKEKDEEIERLKAQLSSVHNLMYRNGYSDAIDCYDTFGKFNTKHKPNAKSRSIVAMLFWEWRKYNSNFKNEENSFIQGRASKTKELFYKAHKMLKEQQ